MGGTGRVGSGEKAGRGRRKEGKIIVGGGCCRLGRGRVCTVCGSGYRPGRAATRGKGNVQAPRDSGPESVNPNFFRSPPLSTGPAVVIFQTCDYEVGGVVL